VARILYIDARTGLSGDKLLAGFLDLGLPFHHLRDSLARLDVEGYELRPSEATRSGLRGTSLEVALTGAPPLRTRDVILRTIQESGLEEPVKAIAVQAFDLILAAEGKVHGQTKKDVHLHELGAVDALVDIVGTAIAVDYFRPDRIVCSPVNVGSGSVETAHGLMTVPAPATAEILRGNPTYAEGPVSELTTPTGATIAVALATAFGPQPLMAVERVGYGAGRRDFDSMPNVLRLFLGTTAPEQDRCAEIEIATNIDDCSPTVVAHAVERLFAAGALDAFVQPVQMKKGRPGLLLTAIVPASLLETAANIVFRETSSIGVRYREVSRIRLERQFVKVTTPYGDLPVKVSSRQGEILQITPEFDDARRLAIKSSVPIASVLAAAVAAFRRMKIDVD